MSKYLIKLSSKVISQEWWGQQWCQIIPKYAKDLNRLERGRTYLRKGYVNEITIQDGHISATVKGNHPQDYNVDILIETVTDDISQKVIKQISAINDFRNSILSEKYKNIFTIDDGIFPTINEIHFSCSCPDTARVCKHIAAVLYAFGSILDQYPILIFHIRGIDVESYFEQQLIGNAENLICNMDNRADNERIIEDDMLSELFGVDLITEEIDVAEPLEHKERKEDDIKVIEVIKKEKKKIQSKPEKILLVRNEALNGSINELEKLQDKSGRGEEKVTDISPKCIADVADNTQKYTRNLIVENEDIDELEKLQNERGKEDKQLTAKTPKVRASKLLRAFYRISKNVFKL